MIPIRSLIVAFAVCLSAPAFAQRQIGNIYVPDTSIEQPGDAGLRAHTNHLILVGPAQRARPDGGGTGPSGSMIPSNLRTAYKLPSTGGSGIIAIVDAYDHPNALSDFNTFSSLSYIKLPTEPSTNVTAATNTVFQVVYQGGRKPRRNTGWAQEEALDIEWAHAMAPNAKIVLVECQSNSFADLIAGVDLAASLGAKEISMSWSGGESSGELSNDSHFQAPGVVYLAASGDTGGVVGYPACSPFVVGVGGTSLDMNSGVFVKETGWSGSGGGSSAFEARPGYQDVISTIVGSHRGVPDVSADADPNTGVLVVYNGGGYIFGGTSVSCPCWAGIVNLAGHFYSNSALELGTIYSNVSNSDTINSANFFDIVGGSAGHFSAVTGWDFVTGVGSPNALNGK